MTNMITKITSIAAAAAIITAAIPTAEYLTGTSITSVTASAAAVNTLTLSDLDRIEREWESQDRKSTRLNSSHPSSSRMPSSA